MSVMSISQWVGFTKQSLISLPNTTTLFLPGANLESLLQNSNPSYFQFIRLLIITGSGKSNPSGSRLPLKYQVVERHLLPLDVCTIGIEFLFK
ncbi:hypothetical protein CDAR_76001 [Caerostris darwini]|uniref:Uncharacterized protein n=1 Tax=Caerostris darwini TaxID=1538125 RepID=A0AAV4QCD3_9ARAC|nr:hypothetical protein CDAR_76001 [Caerostris darwini]